MGFLNKLGIAMGGSVARESSNPLHNSNGKSHNGNGVVAAVGSTRAPQMQEINRVSNGLKELLWNLDGLGRGTMLDLGPAWQTTLSFFIERGFRVSSEDILRGWKEFLTEEEARLREAGVAATPGRDALDMTPGGRAMRFLTANLQYPKSSFDAVLLWDLLDYLEPEVAKQTVAWITELLRPGGVVFAMFHSKKPEGFQRYRVADSNTLQVISSAMICPAQKIYQNREIQDLFARYRTSKSFVGRDQLRESLFIK
ncbi:MAG: class I SAM-dependent methyltransferase [Candidatus Acidiferrum sp.]|jgi:cyclopropane fatty-acyl-phospholipid synthase-like methyltransferase